MGGAHSAWQRDLDSVIRKDTSESLQGHQILFLLRLQRLITLRRNSSSHITTTVLKGLDRCIYSTYCDCLEAGVGDEARQLLK